MRMRTSVSCMGVSWLILYTIKMASYSPSDHTLVTMVCQRCSQPIKLNRTLEASELIAAANGLSKDPNNKV